MAKKVPFHVDFKTIGAINVFADWLLYVAVFASAVILLLDAGYIPGFNGQTQQGLSAFICYLSVGYFVIDILVNYLFQCAEAYRRNDFFDNSLNTALADQNSEEYFTNDSITASIYKMGVNCFENSLFTKCIANRMLRRMFIKALLVFFLFLAVALFAGNKWLIIVLQLALPLTIIQQTIRLFFFRNRVELVYEIFKRIFTMPRGDSQDHLIVHNVTNYETALAWATIKLDDSIFNKMNPQLSTDWNNLKQRLNIQ